MLHQTLNKLFRMEVSTARKTLTEIIAHYNENCMANDEEAE